MIDLERARVIALTLFDGQEVPDEAGVRRLAESAANLLMAQSAGSTVDIDALTRVLEANLNVVVDDGSILTGDESMHVPWLPQRRASIEWGFTRRYRRFLMEGKGWALAAIRGSDDLTDRLLELLEDPERTGPWDRRGMVVGEVQSGKTSNYIEVICKAADAGYKFIVILTGTTNSLRAQTQLRFDEGFLGWDTRLNLALKASNKRVGVGTLRGEPLRRAIPSTNATETGDFNLRIANQFNVRLGGDPVIMVVKKNGSVLRNLTNWAKSLHSPGADESIPDIPILVIDDEADFASVNTRPASTGDAEDPTVINGRIRGLLNAFEKRVYVGYTATPFANIFIHPDHEASGYGQDLFPRDFLINLPVPSNHVGPTRVFGLPEDPDDDTVTSTPLPVVRPVSDHEEHIPSVHRSGWVVDRLPHSLMTSIRAFILVCAARAARGHQGQHNSMLIHVTRFVNVQDRVAELVRLELRDLQDRIRYGDGASPSPIMNELRLMWHQDFAPTTCDVRELHPELAAGCDDLSWEEVQSHLIDQSQRIQVKVINGAAMDALDYWDHPEGLSAIAIGGDKLSRGLTLEGLSVSYYLRASRMYDTLLQMGRWFGYRPGYVDLCRLYTTDDLREFYSHITMATQELRQEFDLMAARGMTPREFGLRVRSHPAGLTITAANKMRNGTRMTVSYSGAISETITFDKSNTVNRGNHNRIDRFIRSLREPHDKTSSNNRVWRRVPGEAVADLLGAMDVHQSSRKVRADSMARYISTQNAVGGLVNWTVALISNVTVDDPVEVGGQMVNPLTRTQHPEDSGDLASVYRIRRLLSPTDEMIDLSDGQREQVRNKQIESNKSISPIIRETRDASNGLLLLYPLRERDNGNLPIIGFAASFPHAGNDTPVDYVVNTVYWQQEMDL